jgi:hypothetical protein
MRGKRGMRGKSGSVDELCPRTVNPVASRWYLWTERIDADFDSFVAVGMRIFIGKPVLFKSSSFPRAV